MGTGVLVKPGASVATKIQQTLGSQLLRRVVICIPVYPASYSVKRNSSVGELSLLYTAKSLQIQNFDWHFRSLLAQNFNSAQPGD